MTTTRRVLRRRAAGILAALVSLPGCLAAPQGDVEGKVRLDGRDVPSGIVTFAGSDGTVVSAVVHDGSYKVVGVAVGEAKISITDHNPHAPAGLLNTSGSRRPPGETAVLVIPERYARPDSSGLTFRVEKGTQKHDIELQP
jgi:hypothetical protein